MYFTLYLTASCFPTDVFTSRVLIANKRVKYMENGMHLTRSLLLATRMVALPSRLELETRPAISLSAWKFIHRINQQGISITRNIARSITISISISKTRTMARELMSSTARTTRKA